MEGNGNEVGLDGLDEGMGGAEVFGMQGMGLDAEIDRAAGSHQGEAILNGVALKVGGDDQDIDIAIWGGAPFGVGAKQISSTHLYSGAKGLDISCGCGLNYFEISCVSHA